MSNERGAGWGTKNGIGLRKQTNKADKFRLVAPKEGPTGNRF